MKSTVVYSGNLSSLQIETDTFAGYDSFVIATTSENIIIVSAVLTGVIPVGNTQQTRDISFGSLEVATDTLYTIPAQLREVQMKLYLFPELDPTSSEIINISIIVYDNKDACDTAVEKLDGIEFRQNIDLLQNTAVIVNQLAQDAALAALAAGLGASLAPYTLGASLALIPAVTTPLIPGITALTPLLLPGL